MTAPSLAIIGCGGIAEFHVPATRTAGFEVTAAASRPGSVRVGAFAQRHGIPHVYADPASLLAADNWDAVLIAAPAEETLSLLTLALERGRPILVEKPVGLHASQIAPLTGRDLPVIAGYNRRFYAPVRAARDEVERGSPVVATLELHETINAPAKVEDDSDYLSALTLNSVHGFDIARFTLGNLRVVGVQRLESEAGVVLGIAAILVSSRGDVLQYTAHWQSPANFAFTIHRAGRRFELRPFEAATVYEGMKVVDPTEETPIRVFSPVVSERIPLEQFDLSHKPGFVAQARALRALVAGEDPGDAARLDDAYEVLRLVEEIRDGLPSLGTAGAFLAPDLG